MILAVMTAFTVVSAQAQTVLKSQKFTIPFAFQVGDKVMPAGEYTVSTNNQTIVVRKNDGKRNVLAIQQRIVGTTQPERTVKLTFRRFNNEYYLSQVWLQDGVGRELKRQRNASTDLARNFEVVDLMVR